MTVLSQCNRRATVQREVGVRHATKPWDGECVLCLLFLQLILFPKHLAWVLSAPVVQLCPFRLNEILEIHRVLPGVENPQQALAITFMTFIHWAISLMNVNVPPLPERDLLLAAETWGSPPFPYPPAPHSALQAHSARRLLMGWVTKSGEGRSSRRWGALQRITCSFKYYA